MEFVLFFLVIPGFLLREGYILMGAIYLHHLSIVWLGPFHLA
jgi:hypothetical protein